MDAFFTSTPASADVLTAHPVDVTEAVVVAAIVVVAFAAVTVSVGHFAVALSIMTSFKK